jgi:hypothetical protein
VRGCATKSFVWRFGPWISLVLSGLDRLRSHGDARLLNNARSFKVYRTQGGAPAPAAKSGQASSPVAASREWWGNGCPNADLRQALDGQAAAAGQWRRQSAAVRRRWALVRAQGVSMRVPKAHRSQLRAWGQRMVTALRATDTGDGNRWMAAA